jgi:GT2 family glycosyltransferase
VPGVDSSNRPGVDVVVPFAGAVAALEHTLERLARIDLAHGDTFVVADNRAAQAPPPRAVRERAQIVPAHERPGSYHARNVGASAGKNEWIVFVDADVDAPLDLIDAYFRTPPADETAVLVGGLVDQPAAERETVALRYAHLSGLMSQGRTAQRADWVYAQTANCAVRRTAFEQVGGFTPDIRSGGDADLCFRLRHAGWAIEQRPEAAVVHRSRVTMRALLRQRIRVGAGAAWLEREYPGFSPHRPLWRVVGATVRLNARGAGRLARGDRDAAVLSSVEGICDAAFQLGKRLPNRPIRGRR